MPKRTDIKSILMIGSGPIIIGQACEFDYSGTQALKALKEEGYRVILVNSNPATIMTDPEFSDATYIEPLKLDILTTIIERERPDALLPTLGGQTALNKAVELHDAGVLQKYNVELIGAGIDAIKKAEDRDLFKIAMTNIGLDLPESGYAENIDQAWEVARRIGFPNVIRPSFTLGGTGGSIAYSEEQFNDLARWGLEVSPVNRILVEESVLGWKEFELEVMRDGGDNVVIICSIENFDPMGVHTGDSITIAPAQTLTDKEYQILRDQSIAIIREIGVDTGGSNIQFAVHPDNGRVVVIEMNPRVSRSSALASKATGFPIAKIAAKLAVGYTLDEIANDITLKTPASFEPTIDYVVTKIPRFTFEKFPSADRVLNTQMKSVGEVMAIGRTFKESLQKAIRSLEIDVYGLDPRLPSDLSRGEILQHVAIPTPERLWYLADAIRAGISLEDIYEASKVDPWFLGQIAQIVEMETDLARSGRLEADDAAEALRDAKAYGFSDIRLAQITGKTEKDIRELREKNTVIPVYKRVDTCAAEFEAHTPYLYSSYEDEDESAPTDRKKIVILGGGPNRIGQGIEFDYCCVHGAFALKEDNYETIMVNCNPETVSTDYDTSDRLYFEPLTFEDVVEIVKREKPDGVIVQFGGQTPLKLAVSLWEAGVPIIGTLPDAIDRAEDRKRFKEMLIALGLNQPPNDIAHSYAEVMEVAERIGYPLVVRPSYVLGGRAMEIVHNEQDLKDYLTHVVQASPEHPILVDGYLTGAVEIDVDAVADGENVVIGGIMEHIEEAGVHSGDSSCSLPPYSLGRYHLDEIRRITRMLALELKVKGLMNLQLALKEGEIFVLEVNPRASRTIPFVSKAIGVPLAKIGARVMAGKKLHELGFTKEILPDHVSVKEAVFPFIKFPGVDVVLGPEMKSTGEVMGIDREFGPAFLKSQYSTDFPIPSGGMVFLSVAHADKANAVIVARRLKECGFTFVCTNGTAVALEAAGIPCTRVDKVHEKRDVDVIDLIRQNKIALLINTSADKKSMQDSYRIRLAALNHNVPYFTTIAGANALSLGLRAIRRGDTFRVVSLQEYHGTKNISKDS
ncbi:carbamoyl-phosphate synthase large subunit [Desulfomonile tiedjei]|uniref:Carbamoyl phosphate synthase large chain n=1 Tax=Desulfomonile tiedjei (strain ATCC 49306 / DSM 6799 / DCB-1) TaxID=706587 RepID=I4C8G9_DESTA|nr:carbamoyl-phosphate synthase large subunit [Desulfomonile tiedjei]AFM25860.1 carbamoyl-phosphate synthase large subunit [Desulfomonile tiedjei DSM 6799]